MDLMKKLQQAIAFDLPVRYSQLSSDERQMVREQYIREQKGCCYWCNSLLKYDPPDEIMEQEIDLDLFPPGFLNHPIHLQHDHFTDMTEGAVHAYCNAVMWEYHGR